MIVQKRISGGWVSHQDPTEFNLTISKAPTTSVLSIFQKSKISWVVRSSNGVKGLNTLYDYRKVYPVLASLID